MNIDLSAIINVSPDDPKSFAIDDNYLYILASSTPLNKIIVYDISDPFNPSLESTVSSSYLTGASDISICPSNDCLYVITNYMASGKYRSKIVSFTKNPSGPSFIEECETYVPPDSSVYLGDFIRLDNSYEKPRYIRNAVSGTFDTMWGCGAEYSISLSSPRSLFIDVFGYAYVVEGLTSSRNVKIYDTTALFTPTILGTISAINVDGNVVTYVDTVVDTIGGGTYAYIVGYHYSGGSIYIDVASFNVFDPTHPVFVDVFSFSGGGFSPNRISISNNNLHVCVTYGTSRLVLLNISNPANISYEASTTDSLNLPYNSAFDGNFIYVLNKSGTEIVVFEIGESVVSSSSSSTELRTSSSTEIMTTSSSSSTELRSSSESSSSSSSNSSSSSSSNDYFYKEITQAIVNENHFNLIPFTWIGETGTACDLGDDAKLSFIVQASNSAYVDYQAVINRDENYFTASPTTLTPTIYVPNSIGSEYQHENDFYVDIIANDKSGISEVRTHSEPNKYQFEKVNAVFFIPKFSWDNTIPSNTSTTTTESSIITTANVESIEFENAVWVGTEQGVLKEFQYKKNPSDSIAHLSSNANGITTSSYIHRLLFSSDSNDIYISGSDFIYVYGSAVYLDGEENYHKNTIYNNSASMATLYSSNVWSVQPYYGKVVESKPSTLDLIKEYSGFDAPFKVVKSAYHNSYFVAGTHILWVINGNSKKPVYEINDYKIADLDIMENGKICILFHGLTDDIIRIIDNNLYTILLDQRVNNETLRFCKACKKGKFYILSELNIVDFSYPSAHYVFDTNSKQLSKTEQLAQIATTTSTTTAPVITKAVKVQKPNGEEIIQRGSSYEIQWATSKSISDFVKIDLHKGGNFYSSIVDKTANSGIYKWAVSTDFEDAETYQIRITWISASSDPNNYSDSDNYFSLTGEEVTTTTTTSLFVNAQHAVGIDYDAENDLVVFALKSGLFGMYHIPSLSLYGLINGEISNVTCMACRDVTVSILDRQTKVRIFVGSEIGLSDKWDSGEIETRLTSCYYGGGNNLEPGRKYYVHIQTYSEKFGWSELQIKEFIMKR